MPVIYDFLTSSLVDIPGCAIEISFMDQGHIIKLRIIDNSTPITSNCAQQLRQTIANLIKLLDLDNIHVSGLEGGDINNTITIRYEES